MKLSGNAQAILRQVDGLRVGEKASFPIVDLDPEEVSGLAHRIRSRGCAVYTSSGRIAVQRTSKSRRPVPSRSRPLSPSEALQHAALMAHTLADKAEKLKAQVDGGAPSPDLVCSEKDSMLLMVEHVRDALQWL